MRRKFLASILALCMVMSLLPMAAFAADPTGSATVAFAGDGAGTIKAGEAVSVAITGAKSDGSTPISGDAKVTITSSDTTNDGTDGVVFEDTVSFAADTGTSKAAGSATIEIPAKTFTVASQTQRTLTVTIADTANSETIYVTDSSLKLTINAGDPAKMTVTTPLGAPEIGRASCRERV